MHWMELVASLVNSLAWPMAVVVLASVFRGQIRGLLTAGLKRMKLGPFEAEWSLAERAIPTEIRMAAPRTTPDNATQETASISPTVAILSRYEELMRRLQDEVIARRGEEVAQLAPGDLIDYALSEKLISSETSRALVGLTVMRNLAAHRPTTEVTDEKVTEFIVLAEAAEYAMLTNLQLGA